MDADRVAGLLADIGRVCADTAQPDDLLTETLPMVVELSGARAAQVVRAAGGGQLVVARAGASLDQWPAEGSARSAARPLPGGAGELILAWGQDERTAAPWLSVALATIDGALRRAQAEERLTDLMRRVDNAQQLANMGDYDWHIATDTNRWSDQLYRIYGHEPQSFNASYERFLEHIHPDDRERITEIHRRAYATGEPYEMIERIVRPDGQVRYLSSNGQVVRDASGAPVRMRGTCIDVTDRVLAEQEQEHSAALAASLRETRVRRHQALEINDNVVQGLTAALYSLARGDVAAGTSYLERTVSAARRLMNEWLDSLDGGDLQPGDLVRETASTLDDEPLDDAARDVPPVTRAEPPRILIVDDNHDVRTLIREHVESIGCYQVVGEAADGEEAVQMASGLQPHVVLLDLAMPRMDGLQALPLILEAAPGVRVIVLSGFDQGTMAEKALAAGAARYVEKSVRIDLTSVIAGVLTAA